MRKNTNIEKRKNKIEKNKGMKGKKEYLKAIFIAKVHENNNWLIFN